MDFARSWRSLRLSGSLTVEISFLLDILSCRSVTFAQAQAQMEADAQQVDNAKKMSETSTADGNALTELMREQGLA